MVFLLGQLKERDGGGEREGESEREYITELALNIRISMYN